MAISRIEKIKTICRNKSVLDLGCGGMDARLHTEILSVSQKVVGIEMNEELAKKTRGEVIMSDATDFDLDEKFDVIVAGELIEHIKKLGCFLDNVRRHLKEKGKFILTTPNLQSFYRLLFHPFTQERGHHVIGFNRNTLYNLLESSGFSVKVMEVVPHDCLPLRRKVIDFIIPERFNDRVFCVAEK